MNSYTSRLNTLSTHAMTSLAVLAGVVIALSYLTPRPVPDVEISLHSFRVLKMAVRGRDIVDQAIFRYNVKGDLRQVMDWNVKGIYASVVVEYETDIHQKNQVVIWDAVITSQKKADLNRKGDYPKYTLKDYGNGLRGKTMTMSLRYTIMPYVGALETYVVGKHEFKMPDEYTSR